MKLAKLALPGVLIIENQVFRDSRGSLCEVYKDSLFNEKLGFKNVMEIEVESKKGVLRGLHYQLEPYTQGKIVRVVNGSVLDVVVDIRRSSKTFGKWSSNILSSSKKNQIYVPRGFAHGYYTLENNTKLIYQMDNYYNFEASRGIAYDDIDLEIDWGLTKTPILSEQDKTLPTLMRAEIFE